MDSRATKGGSQSLGRWGRHVLWIGAAALVLNTMIARFPAAQAGTPVFFTVLAIAGFVLATRGSRIAWWLLTFDATVGLIITGLMFLDLEHAVPGVPARAALYAIELVCLALPSTRALVTSRDNGLIATPVVQPSSAIHAS